MKDDFFIKYFLTFVLLHKSSLMCQIFLVRVRVEKEKMMTKGVWFYEGNWMRNVEFKSAVALKVMQQKDCKCKRFLLFHWLKMKNFTKNFLFLNTSWCWPFYNYQLNGSNKYSLTVSEKVVVTQYIIRIFLNAFKLSLILDLLWISKNFLFFL